MGEGGFYVIGNFVPITQKRSAGMRTAAYNADVASDRRRRENAVLNGTRKTLLFRKYIYEIFRFIYFDWLINKCLLFFSVDLLTEQLNLETVVVAISLTTSIQS